MSFILDALKKSESDRQRQGGPALFEVKVAAPRHALPSWAVAIAVLFVANLAVVGWLLLRHAAAPAEEATRAAAHPQTDASPGPAAPAAPAATAPAVVAINTPAAPAPPAVAPAAHGVVTAPSGPAAPAEPASAASNPEPQPNSDDLAPAAEPPPSGSLGRVRRGTDAGVPLYQQLAATPGSQLPQLRLDLHAYAERPGDRWVLINMHKLREGDSLEGARLERITPDGAVLSYQGSQFLLTRE